MAVYRGPTYTNPPKPPTPWSPAPPAGPIEAILQAIFGPPRNPYADTGSPTGGYQGFGDARSSEEQRQAAIQKLQYYTQRFELTDADLAHFYAQIKRSEVEGGPNIDVIMEAIDAAAGNTRAMQDRDEAKRIQDQTRTETLAGLQRIEKEFGGRIDRPMREIDALYDKGPDGGVLNLGKVRSSAEYGAGLAAGENAINADIELGRRQGRMAQAARGVSTSGKLGSMVRAVEQQGAESKGRLQSGIVNDVIAARTQAEQNALGFREGLINARSAANVGDFGRSLQLGDYARGLGQSSNFFGPGGTALDIQGARIGNERANIGMALNFIQNLMAQGQQGMNSMMSLIGGKGG